ncbi:protein kinase [uncultured Spirosoma sp.]|uniref:serine/threonine-protein kinase n=1 Tax=uncultured Spirosoma sp. TaxID=278208 RepID=UPI002582640E|nr:protein kinase [uncultured Spirosoma sp.]
MSSANRRLLNYVLLRELGRGGMATVWYAENSVGRKFAVKILKPELVAEESSVAERFRKEAQIMVRLEHPSLLRVEDFYEDGTTLAIIMDYLAGQDLNQYVREHGAVTQAQAVHWFGEILDAFSYVHQQGYFHRDIKPSNLFLTNAGQVKVMDFGIAKIVGADLSLTQTDVLMGSPLYMSPEQIVSPKSVDFRTDIYSLGVTLYTLLAGHKPYDDAERSMFSIQTDIVQQPLPTLPHVDSRINDIIRQATQKKPGDRFPDCQAFKQALATFTVSEDPTVLQPRSIAFDSETRQMPVPTLEMETVVSRQEPVATPATTPAPTATATESLPPKPSAKSKLPLLIASLAGAVVLGVGALFWLPQRTAQVGADEGQAASRSQLFTMPVRSLSKESTEGAKQAVARSIDFYRQGRYDSALALLIAYKQNPAFLTNAEAVTNLGIIYFFGSAEQHIPQDLTAAEQWLRKGVTGKNAKAAYYLGLLNDGVNFTSVTKAQGKSKQAVELYKAAAEGGDSYAKMTLGELFLERNAYVRTENPCMIKAYLEQAVHDNVSSADGALAALKKQGYCQ